LTVAITLAQAPVGDTREPRPVSKTGAEVGQSAGNLPGEEILVDWIHANDFSMIGLQPNSYEYHLQCGFRRGFRHLESQGVRVKYVSGGQLTPQRLTPHKLLFINLVSAERLPFLVSEIAAIRAFVEQGGSLLVITDHSNCYYHAHRLMPLFTELGIRSFTDTACEHPPRTLGEGNGWITVTRFQPHPITVGLSCIALQAGGCVDPRFAVATTSDASWPDAWDAGIYGEENAPAFVGDFAQGIDEPNGPLGVVMAKSLGQGRIVVVADQNLFSDVFINYADNYRLWLNSMAWLLRDDALQRADSYVQSHSPVVALFEKYDRGTFGSPDADGYYHAMSLLNRHLWTFANDQPDDTANLIVVAHNEYSLTDRQLASFIDHLQRAKPILLLSGGDNFSLESEGLVQTVIQRLQAAPPKVVRHPAKLVVDIPARGSVHILKGERGFDNTSLPSPTEVPSAAEQKTGEALLKAVRDAWKDPEVDRGGKPNS
jgi:hypothetical protein